MSGPANSSTRKNERYQEDDWKHPDHLTLDPAAQSACSIIKDVVVRQDLKQLYRMGCGTWMPMEHVLCVLHMRLVMVVREEANCLGFMCAGNVSVLC